ncbi:MAG: ferritin family protein [bacterium]|nr:ferritin family protein [bacterium]
MRIIKNTDGKIEISDFNAVQAYKIAVNLEKEGVRFYADILGNIANGGIKEDVQLLLGQEKEHLKFFETELAVALKDGRDNFEEDDIIDYMDSGVFSSYKALLKRRSGLLKSPLEVLAFGLLIENDSVDFYINIRRNTLDKRCISAIDKIIEQEKKHIERINKLIKYVEKKGGAI